MKRILIILLVSGIVFAVSGQTKTPPPKPKGTPTSPFVLKTDFETEISALKDKMNSLQGSIGAVNSKMNRRNDSLEKMSYYIDTIIKILNDYNIKIRLTSDSLGHATNTMSNFKETTESSLVDLNNRVGQNKLFSLIALAGLALLLIALIILIVMMNKKISHLSVPVKDNSGDKIEEFLKKANIEAEELKKSIKSTVSKEVDVSKILLDSKITRNKMEIMDKINLLQKQLEELSTGKK